MKFDVRYNNHPADSATYDTETLRERYLIETVFLPNEIHLIYSHHDRIIAGGAYPVNQSLPLPQSKDLGTEYFLKRREMGIINIGGLGWIELEVVRYPMSSKDGFYIGAGTKDVVFGSESSQNPAKFYINSAPAHKNLPSKYIPFSIANPRKTGEARTLNERTIYQYVHPAVCESCQLVMGMTVLSLGSVWNTMPTHTHERRMEVYFYFNMDETTRVIHLMGEPSETRHLIIANEQGVISPSWSIHSGVGTANYTFIWGMCGENITFDDMDFIPMAQLK